MLTANASIALRWGCVVFGLGLIAVEYSSHLQVTEVSADSVLRPDDGPSEVQTPRVQNTVILDEVGHNIETVCTSEDRRTYVQEMCEAQGWASEPWNITEDPAHGLVDHKHRLFYCLLSKVGSISFRKLMATVLSHNTSLSAQKDSLDYAGLKYIIQMEPTEQMYIVDKYKTLLVVRHPLDRLRSAYEAKLSKPGKFNAQVLDRRNRAIVDQYFAAKGVKRKAPFDPWKETLTFVEFLEIVGTQYENGFVNGHWIRYFDRCHICHIEYDIIVRLETIDTDLIELYDYYRDYERDHMELVEVSHSNVKHDRDDLALTNKFRDMSKRYQDISGDTLRKVMSVYERDLRLFGYWADKKHTQNCEISLNNSIRCC